MHQGVINQIIGPVIDIKFEEGELPELLKILKKASQNFKKSQKGIGTFAQIYYNIIRMHYHFLNWRTTGEKYLPILLS